MSHIFDLKNKFPLVIDTGKILKDSSEFFKHSLDDCNNQYYLFAVFSLIFYGIPFQFWSNTHGSQSVSGITIRATASLLSFLLILKDTLPERAQKFFPVYWSLALLFCLPFASTYMLIMGMVPFPWLFFAIFLLNILVNWILFIAISVIGCTAAVIFAGNEKATLYLNSEASQTFTIYACVFLILVISLFMRNRDRLHKERIKAYSDLSGHIAHEIRKPLVLIKNGCEGFSSNSLHLFSAYEAAIRAGVYENKISPMALVSLKKLPYDFNKTVNDGLLFVETLLIQTQASTAIKDLILTNSNYIINTILERWHSGTERHTKTEYNDSYSFKFHCSETLLRHIIFELFRNSEHFIDTAKIPTISIWCVPTHTHNEIHIKDNGQGIDRENIQRVLNYGFSTRKSGTGIGLSFCRSGMKQMGGDIQVYSEKGCFTKIVLRFPQIV